MRSDLKKLDSFTLETSKNDLDFLRNGRVRVKPKNRSIISCLMKLKKNIYNRKENRILRIGNKNGAAWRRRVKNDKVEFD